MSTVGGSWSRPKIVNDGLVLYLDASAPNSYSPYFTPTTWKDLSGNNNNNGTLTNGPTFNSGNGGSIVFDGVNDLVNIPSVNLSSTNVITISFFCKILNYRQITNSGNILIEITGNFNSQTTGAYIGFGEASTSAFLSTFPKV